MLTKKLMYLSASLFVMSSVSSAWSDSLTECRNLVEKKKVGDSRIDAKALCENYDVLATLNVGISAQDVKFYQECMAREVAPHADIYNDYFELLELSGECAERYFSFKIQNASDLNRLTSASIWRHPFTYTENRNPFSTPPGAEWYSCIESVFTKNIHSKTDAMFALSDTVFGLGHMRDFYAEKGKDWLCASVDESMKQTTSSARTLYEGYEKSAQFSSCKAKVYSLRKSYNEDQLESICSIGYLGFDRQFGNDFSQKHINSYIACLVNTLTDKQYRQDIRTTKAECRDEVFSKYAK